MLPGRSCTETDALRSIAPPTASSGDDGMLSDRMILPGADAVVNGWPPSEKTTAPYPTT